MQAVNGVQNFGMVKFRSPAAVQQEAVDNVRSNEPSPETVSSLAGYLGRCWQQAKQAKQPTEQQMLKNLRMDNGAYEPGTLAAIRQMGGSEVYVLLTATKCRAAEAWINDILRPVGERPWTITPTPIPDLPPDLKMTIEQEVRDVFEEVLTQAQQVNQQIQIAELKEEIRKYAEKRRDKTMTELMDEAKLRCTAMADKIDDQLTEGGWHDSWWAVVSDFVRLKAGIIKGPVIRVQKSQAWNQQTKVYDVEKAKLPTYDRVSPLDLYPAPDSRGVDDGYLIERHQFARKDLIALIGVPGYSEENIRKIIKEYGVGGKREHLSTDAERAMFDFGSTQSMFFSDKIDVLEFWGSVPGSMLIDWGMQTAQVDPEMEYEINAFIAGSYVFRAVLNPDKLGRKPYSVDSFQRVPGSFWGKGVPELMSDTQDICNSVARALVNNSQLASGPMVEANSERLGGQNVKLYPWMIIQSTNAQMLEAPAMRFYQPQLITDGLLRVYELFSVMSEDQTGIPRWAYGNSGASGANATAQGLSMLMTSASRNVKEAISHLDRMTEGTISRTYDYNMLYDPDMDLKGDAKVVARGVTSYLAKEQKTQRLNEALATTNNPTDLQIVGIEGRAKILKAIFRELAPEMDIIPDDNKLKELIAKIEQQQAQQLQAQAQQNGSSPMGGSQPGSGVVPQQGQITMDAAGNPAGGVDSNMFQNQPGVHP
jgi:hypothetical protein